MNLILKYLLGCSLAMAMSFDARALSITPSTPAYATFNTNSQNLINQALQTMFDPDISLVYKQDVGSSETGAFSSSYSTSFYNTSSDPEDATISYISGSYITAADIYLLVKDGNHSPAAYLFDISGWNGKEALVLTDFWVGGGAISHVTIYSRGTASVPDGGATVALLGMALTGLFVARRLGRVVMS